MKLLSKITLLFYLLIIIKFVVFKDMDMILVGKMRFYFGGTQTGPANWIPFETILAYLRGDKGLLITGLNIMGNLTLLFPLGFLAALTWEDRSFRQVALISLGIALIIEFTQMILHVGIFDIDDVLLNGLGGMIAYVITTKLPSPWQRFFLGLCMALLALASIYYLLFSIPFNPPVHP